jgi:hypothetical protein
VLGKDTKKGIFRIRGLSHLASRRQRAGVCIPPRSRDLGTGRRPS